MARAWASHLGARKKKWTQAYILHSDARANEAALPVALVALVQVPHRQGSEYLPTLRKPDGGVEGTILLKLFVNVLHDPVEPDVLVIPSKGPSVVAAVRLAIERGNVSSFVKRRMVLVKPLDHLVRRTTCLERVL